MSSTNVHSRQKNSKYCASAQIIPTIERGLEIPPKSSKPGPVLSTLGNEENILKISNVGEYEIQKDGKVIDTATSEELGNISLQQAISNKEIRTQRAPGKYSKKSKDTQHGMEH